MKALESIYNVFANEPTIPEALISLDNVLLQPHNAFGTWESREATGKLLLDKLVAHFSNESLPSPI